MSNLSESLKHRKFVITAEVAPRKGTIVSNFIKTVNALKGHADAINITDNQRAIMRMSSLVASYLVLKEGIEPIFQLTCRDRNRLAIQSDLLGAGMLGIKNVLALTGDHPSAGDFPDAKPVFDLDATTLLYTISRFNEGFDLNNQPLNGRTEFFQGAALTPQLNPSAPVLLSIERKINAGARFFQTQPVFNVEMFAGFMEKMKRFNVPVIAGVLLLHSAEQANKLNKQVPGINIPDRLIKRLESSANPLEEGINLSVELAVNLQHIAHGVHIMTVGQEKALPIIVKRIYDEVHPSL
ncbi:MAG: methylenetetrahydrofolate reductase [Deltaproteobacteria bacterium]|nr:methylenetetrahydrofolate reductase [Deltaproteobacteria bacterium]MCL5792317.1 methylenetetrahydrofolate reductase [Deltaproteobacteria bacterium]